MKVKRFEKVEVEDSGPEITLTAGKDSDKKGWVRIVKMEGSTGRPLEISRQQADWLSTNLPKILKDLDKEKLPK